MAVGVSMSSRLSFVQACSVLFLLGHAGSVPGQQEGCPLGNFECLSERFGVACVDRIGGATADTCLAWLVELQRRSDVDAPRAMVTLGYTYSLLARLSEDRDVARSYREQAATTFRQVREEDPANVQALYGLVSIAETPEQRVDYLRQVVAISPSDLQAVNRLANALTNVGGLANNLERINVQERAYAETDLRFGQTQVASEELRWRLVGDLASSYRWLVSQLMSSDADSSDIADAEANLASFIGRARSDLRIEAMVSEINREPAADPGQTTTKLSSLCRSEALSVFGANACMDSLAVVIEAVATSGGSVAGFQLADVVASTMVSMAGDYWLFIRMDYPDWIDQSVAALRRLMASGMETAALYAAYSTFESDPEARLTALQRGSALFPADGEVALELGMEYLRRGRSEDAIAQFLIAQDGLPDYSQGRVDRLTSIARGEVDARVEWVSPANVLMH
jgi:tetratricopeptide (TPR) repeat protein